MFVWANETMGGMASNLVEVSKVTAALSLVNKLLEFKLEKQARVACNVRTEFIWHIVEHLTTPMLGRWDQTSRQYCSNVSRANMH